MAEIWSHMVIDGHNVIAEYVPPGETLPETAQVSDTWYGNHVRESQYFLQITKCADDSCCAPRRSALKNILYQGFFPAPFPMSQNPFRIPNPDEVGSEIFPSLLVRQCLTLRPDFSQGREIPYDTYCPSIKDDITGRTCTICGLYFASKSSMNNHRKNVHGSAVHHMPRVRPLRVLSRRPQEVLCIVKESVEWIDVEAIDEEKIITSEDIPPDTTAPVIYDVSEWIDAGNVFVEDD